MPFPPNLPLSTRGIFTPYNTPNGISFESAVLPQYMLVNNGYTDSQTDQQNDDRTRSVRIGHLTYMCDPA